MQFGDYQVEVIPDAEFWLDGGAMFGVVPRNLWSKVYPPDDQNRVRLSLNCLFVDTGRDKVLVETGLGEKWSPKQRKLYGIQRKRSFAESLLSITNAKPEEITIVVNTHLHFDHAGGNTRLAEEGTVVPSFPNARYLVARAEWEHAEHPTERDQASYLPENWQPLHETGQLELREETYEVVPGLRMETYPGHNRSMQCWRFERAGQTIFGFADLVPTSAHLALPWIMGYDLFPLETLEAKKRLLPQAVRESWICHFYHDPETPLCRVTEENNKLTATAWKGVKNVPGQ